MEAFVSAAAQILLQTICIRLFIEGSLKHAAVPRGCETAICSLKQNWNLLDKIWEYQKWRLSFSCHRLSPAVYKYNDGFLKIHPSFSSVQFNCSVVSDSLQPHGLQHAKPPCPAPTPRACSNSCPSYPWCHPTIKSSVIPFSPLLQSFPASGSFPMSQFFTSGGQSIGVSTSTSVLPMNIQSWFPLGLTAWISLQSKGLSRVFSNTTVQNHQFFCAQLSLRSNSHIHRWLLEKP